MIWPHTIAILAGGGSRRMGKDKRAIPLPDGRTMIELVCDSLRSSCREIVILASGHVLDGLEHIADPVECAGAGPLAGITALLESGRDDRYIVVPCDVPLIGTHSIRSLATAPNAIAAVLRQPGRESFDALPIRLEAIAASHARTQVMTGDRSIKSFVASLDHEIVDVDDICARELFNVNDSADLRAVMARL